MARYKLAVLDDYAKISPCYLKQYSDKIEISYFPETLNADDPEDFEKLVERLSPFELISSMRERTKLRESLIERLPNLKIIFTTGYVNRGIDVAAFSRRGITVVGTAVNVPDSGFDTTTEQNWALILGLAKSISVNDNRVKSNPTGWQESPAVVLGGKTLGLLGLGRLGLQSAVTGRLGFGMNIIAWSPNLTQEKANEAAQCRGLAEGSIKVTATKEELFRTADVVNIHLTLGDRSRNAVDRQALGWMKKSAMLVNTSRGPIVDEDALLESLDTGNIFGYASDVFNVEPLPKDSKWRSNGWGQNGKSHVLISPHMGYVTGEILHTMYQKTAENIAAYLEGRDFELVLEE